MSNVSKGTYYKLKTKKWLVDKGYQVEYLERFSRIYDKKKKKVIWIKRDLFASDMLAINKNEIIFVQVKFGKKNVAQGIKAFAEFDFPKCVQKWVVIWQKGDHEPEIQEV